MTPETARGAPAQASAGAPELALDPGTERLNTRAAGIIGVAVMCSRVLGLLREQVFAALFGGGGVMDAFTAAFRIPNLLRDLFAEGALSTAGCDEIVSMPSVLRATRASRIVLDSTERASGVHGNARSLPCTNATKNWLTSDVLVIG